MEVRGAGVDRSTAIDFLRGASILTVVWYHYVQIPILNHGFYGVLLFFVISGYCIPFSVESSHSGWQFYAKRLGRLMPALIVCGALTTYLKSKFPELMLSDRQVISWWDYVSFLVSAPTLGIFRVPFQMPDGAYWSLLVEFQFYVVCFAGIIVGARDRLIWFVCIVALLHTLTTGLAINGSFDFFPFFICGMGIAAIVRRKVSTGVAAILFAWALDLYHLKFGFVQPSAPIGQGRTEFLWVSTLLVAAAAFCPRNRYIVAVLRPISWIGLISYPLYLVHQEIGLMIIKWLNVPANAWILRAVAVPACMALVAWLVYFFVERRLIKPLSAILSGKFKLDSAAHVEVVAAE
ncbi:acyltransferase [Bradyrhizobium sp. dw_78]|uniref:acyltransferase family protein n=1 Tax=Bradyrhizobium sp. dw_78 TaxID=2719793 RepID=UPI001BD656D4|nr:acyltransferase [Bradyrhizobium sp. dw_78]